MQPQTGFFGLEIRNGNRTTKTGTASRLSFDRTDSELSASSGHAIPPGEHRATVPKPLSISRFPHIGRWLHAHPRLNLDPSANSSAHVLDPAGKSVSEYWEGQLVYYLRAPRGLCQRSTELFTLKGQIGSRKDPKIASKKKSIGELEGLWSDMETLGLVAGDICKPFHFLCVYKVPLPPSSRWRRQSHRWQVYKVQKREEAWVMRDALVAKMHEGR